MGEDTINPFNFDSALLHLGIDVTDDSVFNHIANRTERLHPIRQTRDEDLATKRFHEIGLSHDVPEHILGIFDRTIGLNNGLLLVEEFSLGLKHLKRRNEAKALALAVLFEEIFRKGQT